MPFFEAIFIPTKFAKSIADAKLATTQCVSTRSTQEKFIPAKLAKIIANAKLATTQRVPLHKELLKDAAIAYPMIAKKCSKLWPTEVTKSSRTLN